MAILAVLVFAAAGEAAGQGVKRVVMLKIDGLPGYFVEEQVKKKDPATGRSILPWIEEVFYKNGTRVPNFYTRGMSLSGPSWGTIDTGQHLQIKGNVEYDRFTLHAYDYLNFIPYYIQYGLNKKVDMPAVEVLDELGIPLLYDIFPYEKRYISHQLFQRGNEWEVLAGGFIRLYPGSPWDFIDEWTMGLDFRKTTVNQVQRDIVGKLLKRPEVDYFDLYDASFDHVAHNNNDLDTRLAELKSLDRAIGRVWTAIQNSPRYNETALILISDHGFNAKEKVYSQGFNLVKLLAAANGGGHHVVTKRRLMADYSIKGTYPLIPLIKSSSPDSYYLKGQSGTYPTALVDFDGNERSSIHLRDTDLNLLHILLTELQQDKLSPEVKAAATEAFFEVVDKNRAQWLSTVDQMREELSSLWRLIEAQQKQAAKRPEKFTPEESARGLDKEARRVGALAALGVEAETDYRNYLTTLTNLLALKRDTFDARRIKIEEVIAPGAMGDPNSVNELQNYVIGAARKGLVLNADKRLDMDKSFVRVNYFELLQSQQVRNNVQKGVGNKPVDFTAVRLPLASVADALPPELTPTEDPIWLYAGPDCQALILSRIDPSGGRKYRFLPIARLSQDGENVTSFQLKDWADGFPLKYFEDPNFGVPAADRAGWLSDWHSEVEWLNAIHRTIYSNAIIGLNEQLDRHPLYDRDDGELSSDERLIRRFRQRQRRLSEADMLVLANNHWNFDVKGFNPGGNHGSFFRVSTNATLMLAGGDQTGIPRGLNIEAPYDTLSFAPTLMRLLGKIDGENRPNVELQELGFRRFPGRVITEVLPGGNIAGAKK